MICPKNMISKVVLFPNTNDCPKNMISKVVLFPNTNEWIEANIPHSWTLMCEWNVDRSFRPFPHRGGSILRSTAILRIIPIKRPCPYKRPSMFFSIIPQVEPNKRSTPVPVIRPICSGRFVNYAHKPLKTRPPGTNIWSVSMCFDIYRDWSHDFTVSSDLLHC